ncbi:MAG: penicillin-binding transpeptidase domain-containing protein, partial [Balneolaceae bacterium]
NGGFRVPLNVIREVLDSERRPLQRRELNVTEVFDSGAVFLTNYLLTRVVESGTASQLSRYFPDTHSLAGKTGTTNESRDSWFVGYDDEILGVTWLGRDDNQPTPFTGASGAMQIWADTMQAVSVRPLQLIEPESISWTEALQIHYEGECLDIGRVPYIGTKHPENTLSCQTTPDRGGSGFNPFNWFN